MNVALVVITDGRWGYLADTLASAHAHLDYPFSDRIIINDSGEPFPSSFLTDPGSWHVVNHPQRLGLAGAVGSGMDAVRWADADFYFWLEDDFTFPQPVPVADMVDKLKNHPELAQVALLRQPWSPEEHQAGGILGMNPDAYTLKDGMLWHTGREGTLFTFNPHLAPRVVADYGGGLERDVTDNLVAKGYQFAFYGQRTDPPRCWHIGTQRSAGYRW